MFAEGEIFFLLRKKFHKLTYKNAELSECVCIVIWDNYSSLISILCQHHSFSQWWFFSLRFLSWISATLLGLVGFGKHVNLLRKKLRLTGGDKKKSCKISIGAMFSAKPIISMVLIPKLEIRFCLDDRKADFRLT